MLSDTLIASHPMTQCLAAARTLLFPPRHPQAACGLRNVPLQTEGFGRQGEGRRNVRSTCSYDDVLSNSFTRLLAL